MPCTGLTDMFFDSEKAPYVTAMIQCRTSKECAEKIIRSINGGADCLGVQLCQLNRDQRAEENLKEIFTACAGYPVYITSYRYNKSEGMTDSECADLLVFALKVAKSVGVSSVLCDIPGDLFDKNDFQITENEAAAEQQKEVVNRIHSLGGEVLISTHDMRNLSLNDIKNIAQIQTEHGADVIKIVVKSDTAEKLPEFVSAIAEVKKAFQKPFLFLDGGECANVIRKTGPSYGACMYLCVESYSELDTPTQPALAVIRAIKDNMAAKNQ